MEIGEDIEKVKWNFITLILGLFSFFFLKSIVSDFVDTYGDKVRFKNIFVEGYLGGTGFIILCIILTILLLSLTAFFAFKSGPSLTGTLQIITAVVFIIWSLCLGWVPFFGTILMLGLISIFIYLAAND